MQNSKLPISYPTTLLLLTICFLMFLISIGIDYATGSNLSFSSILYFLGAENVPAIMNGEVWRLVTAAFLHADLIHLAFNLYALWFLGRYVETFFGSKVMFTAFIFSAILGSLFSFLAGIGGALLNFADNSFVVFSIGVGASGGIFGLVGILIGNKVRKDPFSPEIPVDETALIIMVIANFIYGLIMQGVDNWAHLGGLIGGFLLAYLYRPTINFGDDKKEKFIRNFSFWLCVALVILGVLSHIIYSIFTFRS